MAAPLYEKHLLHSNLKRGIELAILALLVSLLVYRFVSLENHDTTWLVALCCESWFTFIWVINVCTKWSPARFNTYPERLIQQVKELPAVDMFVTTADPVLEPPILTVNTVLSLLAVDYPSNRLALYVSDDACSPLMFYALSESAKFAQRWVPFCNQYKVKCRAPFRYFTADQDADQQPPPLDEWQQIKGEYEELSQKIEEASKRNLPVDICGDYAVFRDVDRRDHPPIVKIIWENKEGNPNGVPHIIYVSREKRPKHHHRYKAGAMNALIRVSGIMTNAPFMLNVDCDMYANNPQVALHAMCVHLASKSENEVAFVQFPQEFYDELKDDPFGNQLKGLYYIARGITGLQGAFYGGTGCFHRRKVIYGLWPGSRRKLQWIYDDESIDTAKLKKTFGTSDELCKSAADVLKGQLTPPKDLSTSLEAAHRVAVSNYDFSTLWGKEVGLRYGSTTEDVLTGLSIHAKGWRSVFCTPEPPAFKGCAPTSGPASMTQQKRWSTGLLEILVSKNCPVISVMFGRLQLSQCMAYLWIMLWNIRSIPELIYALLPPYCLISNSNFLPPVHDRGMLLLLVIFTVYTVYQISEYVSCDLSIRTWWNNQKMARITSACAWSFGVLAVVLKLLGVSDTVFEITKKEQSTSSSDDADVARFTFDESPFFVPGTALLLVQLAALAVAALGLRQVPRGDGSGFGEVACALYLVLCFWPFLTGLVAKGKFGIPPATICKAAIVAAVFLHFCRSTSRV